MESFFYKGSKRALSEEKSKDIISEKIEKEDGEKNAIKSI